MSNNSHFLLQAAYKEDGDRYLQEKRPELRYIDTLWAKEGEIDKQKMVLAQLVGLQTLYVSFCGSKDSEDWKTNLDIDLVVLEGKVSILEVVPL